MKKLPAIEAYRSIMRDLISYVDKGSDFNRHFFEHELCKEKDFKDLKKEYNLFKTTFFDNAKTSTHFNKHVLKTNPGEIYYSFRGSDSNEDWIQDFRAFKERFDDAKLFSKEDFKDFVKERTSKAMEFFRRTKMTNGFRNININFNIFNDDSKEDLDMKGNKLLRNTLKNINEVKDKIYLHLGFVQQYNSIATIMDREFDELSKNRKFITKITIEGHSLGASIARLAYFSQMMRHPELYSKTICIAMGAPRIGNKFFEKLLNDLGNDRYFIYNIKDDIISYMPPKIMGFSHYPEEILIKPKEMVDYDTFGNHTTFYYMHSLRDYL